MSERIIALQVWKHPLTAEQLLIASLVCVLVKVFASPGVATYILVRYQMNTAI